MRILSFLPVAALAAMGAAPLACTIAPSGGAEGDHATPSTEGPPAADAGMAAASASPGEPGIVVYATVPTGVLCVVATVTGADTETVTAAVATGASSATLSFGPLAAGAITVTANAYNAACPGSGTPSWVAEPVQVNVVAGIATSIQLTLRPNDVPTGTATFSLPAIAIAAGPRTSYAVLSDGTVRAWGADEEGELGTGAAGASSSTPVVVPGVTSAVQIAAGDTWACVLQTSGSLMCWGYNENQMFDQPYGAITAPVVLPQIKAAIQISAAAGGLAFLGVGISAGMVCENGVLGSVYNQSGCMNYGSPAISVASSAGVASDWYTECWVTQEGAAQCNWGPSEATVTYASGATKVFAGIETAGSFACDINIEGGSQCWGANTYAELGLGNSATTRGVLTLALSRGTAIAAAHMCGVLTGGVVQCAGSNAYGQLGAGNNVSASSQLVTGLGNAVIYALAAGQAHTCALDNQGSVHCWGDNDDGELGDGTTTTRFSPVTVQAW